MTATVSTCPMMQGLPAQYAPVGGGGGAALDPALADAFTMLSTAIDALSAAIDALEGVQLIGGGSNHSHTSTPVKQSSGTTMTEVPPHTPEGVFVERPPAGSQPIGAEQGGTQQTGTQQTGGVTPPVSQSDAELAATIDAYLEKQDSPLAGYGSVFVAAGREYGIDPRLVPAISGIESSFGKHNFLKNNAWGFGDYSWNDFADGIWEVTKQLKGNYVDGGLGKGNLTSVQAISEIYCPVGASNDPNGTNYLWPGRVTEYLTAMGGNPNDVRWNPA